jgi:hypothetical protein
MRGYAMEQLLTSQRSGCLSVETRWKDARTGTKVHVWQEACRSEPAASWGA